MGILQEILDVFSPEQKVSSRFSISINEPQCILKLTDSLSQLLDNSAKKGPPIILCIGTDRSTGDSLGPLTGWRLTPLLKGTGAEIFGTVDDPVHAINLKNTLDKIGPRALQRPVIAVDACLGQVSSPGTIIVENSPLKPGIGVSKNLPAVGDISISGIVNVGGFMEFQILQNTRLSLVMKMAHCIANSIYLAVKRGRPHGESPTSCRG